VRESMEVGRRAVFVAVSYHALASRRLGGAPKHAGGSSMSPQDPDGQGTQVAEPWAGGRRQIARRAIDDCRGVVGSYDGSTGKRPDPAVLGWPADAKGCTGTLRIPDRHVTLIQIGTDDVVQLDRLDVDRVTASPLAAWRHVEGQVLQNPTLPASKAARLQVGAPLASAFGGELKDLVKGKITTIAGRPALPARRQAPIRRAAYSRFPTARGSCAATSAARSNKVLTGYNRPIDAYPAASRTRQSGTLICEIWALPAHGSSSEQHRVKKNGPEGAEAAGSRLMQRVMGRARGSSNRIAVFVSAAEVPSERGIRQEQPYVWPLRAGSAHWQQRVTTGHQDGSLCGGSVRLGCAAGRHHQLPGPARSPACISPDLRQTCRKARFARPPPRPRDDHGHPSQAPAVSGPEASAETERCPGTNPRSNRSGRLFETS